MCDQNLVLIEFRERGWFSRDLKEVYRNFFAKYLPEKVDEQCSTDAHPWRQWSSRFWKRDLCRLLFMQFRPFQAFAKSLLAADEAPHGKDFPREARRLSVQTSGHLPTPPWWKARSSPSRKSMGLFCRLLRSRASQSISLHYSFECRLPKELE